MKPRNSDPSVDNATSEHGAATPGLSYKAAGVDIAAADSFVARIAGLAKATHIDGVVPDRGEYAALFRPNLGGLQDPLIAATCDGVGTKLLVARQMGQYEGLGQDLVAMNVNDLLPVGARPLLFLDYIATGKLDPDQLAAVVSGVATACKASGCALLGGETAEMPGLYSVGDFDLAGFAVGLADGARMPDPKTVQPGDRVLGLASSGVHSNGLSLARKALFEVGKLSPQALVPGLSRPVGAELLTPTSLYVRQSLALSDKFTVKTAAHVTGGGLLGRARRLLQPGQRMVIRPDAYERPAIFDLIAERGHVPMQEMARTFNMGLGYLAVLSPEDADKALSALGGDGWLDVGEVVAGDGGVDLGYTRSA